MGIICFECETKFSSVRGYNQHRCVPVEELKKESVCSSCECVTDTVLDMYNKQMCKACGAYKK